MLNSNNNLNNLGNEELVALLSQYFTQRGQFLAQIIRADLQSMSHLTNHNGKSDRNGTNGTVNYNGNGHKTVARNPVASNPVVEIVSAPQPTVPQQQLSQSREPVSQTNKSVETILVDLVVQQTGYPQESISLELKLLDDLNLDSIKAGELVAAAAKKCGVSGQLDPSALANASLKEVAEIIRSTMPPEEVKVRTPVPVITNNNYQETALDRPQANDNWVRNFAVEYVTRGK